MSLSPNPARRHHIFSQKKLNKNLFKSNITTISKKNQQIKVLESKIMGLFENKIQQFVKCIEDNNQTIKMLEDKLVENQKQLSERNRQNMVQDNTIKQIIQQMIENQINSRLEIVNKKFSEMEEVLASNMFQQHHTLFQLSEQPIRHCQITQNDFLKLKIQMDDKLKQIVQHCSKNNEQIIKKCWQIEQQIRINEQVVQSMNKGIDNVRSKMFSLESMLRSVSYKQQQFRNICGSQIAYLKQELNTVSVEILNIRNARGSMMKKKQNQFKEVQKETSRSQLKSKQLILTRRYQQVLKQSQRYEKPKPLIQRQYKPSSIRTSLTNMKKSVLTKQQFSDVSSISSSVSFLPNPIFIPTKIRTNPSLQSSPKQDKVKITTTLPLKSPCFNNPNFFKQKQQDSLILFDKQSSFNITNQITSPFQQAQYISFINQSDQTKQGFTLSSKQFTSQISCQQKIKQTIYQRNLTTPIVVYLDNGYIMKANGAYLFDHQGNVFNCNKEEFKKLCQQNIFQQK